uniref:Uncharacterized protein n=1 Tax=Leersia perrieri TaxID=77586 RepID=A0A0D9XK55_9ORYZ
MATSAVAKRAATGATVAGVGIAEAKAAEHRIRRHLQGDRLYHHLGHHCWAGEAKDFISIVETASPSLSLLLLHGGFCSVWLSRRW